MGRSTRLRTDFATQADVATHRVHDKGAEIVCASSVRRFLFCSARKSRSALIQLARFD
jgi:hypothetical protein